MLARQMDDARRVREFWFGKLPLDRAALEERMRLWFSEDGSADAKEWDAAIQAEFGARVESALGGSLPPGPTARAAD